MKKKIMRMTILIGLLISIFPIGYSNINAATVTLPSESERTGSYDLSAGNESTALKLDVQSYVRKVKSWEELRTAINEAPVGDVETIIEITESFSSNLSAIYGWNDGTTGKKLLIQSAEGGPYTITRGTNHKGSFFANDYNLGTMTLKNIILDGNGTNVTADRTMIYKAGGTLIMDSGAIIQNIKADAAGGRGAAISNAGGTFIMKAGSIIQNAQNISFAQTGGIYSVGTLIFEGGIITGCKGDQVGGVFPRNSNITVSGVVQITDNHKNNGDVRNLYMEDSSVLTIAEPGLQSGSNIGISKYILTVPADVTTANSKDYSSYFTSDSDMYVIMNTGALDNQVVKLELVSNTASYKVEHYKQSLLDSGYTLYESETKIGTIAATAIALSKTYEGFSENLSHESRIASASINGDGSTVLKLYYDRDTFTVTFKDHDGSILKTETVKYEADASAPKNPVRENYIFDKWDIDFKGVTEDITVTATYIKPSATVEILPKTGTSGMTAIVMILAGITFIGISVPAVKKKD